MQITTKTDSALQPVLFDDDARLLPLPLPVAVAGRRKQVDACGRCSGLLHPTFGFKMGLHDDESAGVDKPQPIISTMPQVDLMMPVTGEMTRSRFQGFGDVEVREPMVRGRGIVGEKSTVIVILGLEERLVVIERQWDEECLARMALES